jgi:carboxyl-terminal processing protease
MSESPKSSYLLPLLLSALLALGFIGGSMLEHVDQKSSSELQKLEDILTLLDQNYVDKVDKDAIFEKTISDMLHELDPHSNYISAKDMKLSLIHI